MKRPWLAFILNFLFPGAGFVYLGKWKWGLLNLLAALFVCLLIGFLLPDSLFEKYKSPISSGLAAGSGALAMTIAKQINSKLQNRK